MTITFVAVVEWRASDTTTEYVINNFEGDSAPHVLILPDGRPVFRIGQYADGARPPRIGYLPTKVVRLNNDGTAYEIDVPSLFNRMTP